MANEESTAVALLKYPITVFSILLALLVAKWQLGITFGAVQEVGPGGVKFSQEAKAELTDIASRLNGALAAIEELRKAAPAQKAKSPEAQATIFEAAQTVSDQTAQLANLTQAPASGSGPTGGFIWIGDYGNGWSRAKLAAVDKGQPITAPPDQLQPGTEYKVLGNMVVRDGLPANDPQYFQGRRSLGTLPRGTKIRLAEKPVAVDRGAAVQYWAKVELP
jgi:hypothetical protein